MEEPSRRKRSILQLCFFFDYLYAFVITAVTANLVRSFQLTALCTFGKRGHIKFPYVGTSFVPSCFGCFSLWNSHFGTSFNNPGKRPLPRGLFQQFAQDGKPWVHLFFATWTGGMVSVHAALRAKALAVLTAQEL